jgi:hypothetical protein
MAARPTPHTPSVDRPQDSPFDELDRLLKSRVVLGEHERTAVCLWIGHTYVYAKFKCTPRLFVTSLKAGCGKSEVMRFIERMSLKGKKLESGSTLASVRDMKNSGYETVCLDQLDDFGKAPNSAHTELKNLFCSGYEIGATIAHKVKDDKGNNDTTFVDCGFPLSLGKIGPLYDAALISRCITIQLTPETKVERKRQMPERMKPLPSDFSERLKEWAKPIECIYTEAPEGTDSRTEDLWQPLLAVAKHAGPAWEERAVAAMTIFSDPGEKPEGKEVKLLRRVVTATKGLSGNGIYSTDLDRKLGISEGGDLTPSLRGLYLKNLGLKAEKRIWETGKKQANGYSLAEIERAGERWLPADQPEPGEGLANAA